MREAELTTSREEKAASLRVEHEKQAAWSISKMTIRPPVAYGNAEVRGQLRAWKTKLAHGYAAFDRAYEALDHDLRAAAVDLVKRSSRAGRERALAKIQRAIGPGPTLEFAHLDGKHPHAVFSILRQSYAAYPSGLNGRDKWARRSSRPSPI
jgi:hypothetical protein